MYRSYYAEMGGTGAPPEIPARAADPAADTGNVTAFRRPRAEAETGGFRSGNQTAAAGGADLCVPRRGLCRDPVLLALSVSRAARFSDSIFKPQLLHLVGWVKAHLRRAHHLSVVS